jgi:hypothetical protein
LQDKRFLLTLPAFADYKSDESWLIKLMKIALLAELASMNVPLKQSLKVTFIKSILRFAPIVAHVQMYAL